MSRLLRLYPAAWRERYGDELLALLDDHPATVSDHLDLIRGALDARVHPQVRGANIPDKETTVNQRLLGVLAAVGGIVWILGFASLFFMPRDVDGFHDSTLAIIAAIFATALIGIALGELGTRPGSATSRRTGHAIAIGSVLAAGTMILGWPALVFGLYALPVIGMLAAGRGAMNGVFPAWFGAVVVVTALASMAGYLGGTGQEAAVVLMATLGLTGLVLGWIALRGRTAKPQEVQPA
jgi:hypothetical protein